MPEQGTKEFVDAIIISIIIASIFSVFLGETANVIREKWMTRLYESEFSLEAISVTFGVMMGWVFLDLFVFIVLFYHLYWMKAKDKLPTNWLQAFGDLLILMPAATFPWVPIHVFLWGVLERQRWDIHAPYVGLWVSFFVVALIVMHFRFKDARAQKK